MDFNPANPGDLNTKVASLLDEVSKAGASPMSPGISSVWLGGASALVFAIADADKYEKLVYESVIDKARPLAEEITQKMNVKITGISSVGSAIRPPLRNLYTTDLLGNTYYSTSPDEINAKANVTGLFSIK
jgi:hypothetical protein